MSYDIDLLEPISGKTIEFDTPHQMRGGTYQVGGSNEASLNITYNYAEHYTGFGEKGIREIYGKSGAESIPMFDRMTGLLGDETSDDYWEPTEGNAKKALLQLKALAHLRPDGIWQGD